MLRMSIYLMLVLVSGVLISMSISLSAHADQYCTTIGNVKTCNTVDYDDHTVEYQRTQDNGDGHETVSSFNTRLD